MIILANLGSPMHWFILALVCLVLFGAKRIPELARNLAKGMSEFKKARREFEKELLEDDASKTEKETAKTSPKDSSPEDKV